MKVTGYGYTQGNFDPKSRAEAAAQASAAAQDSLEDNLRQSEACDPLPCPSCLRHQPYMKAESASRRYGLMGCFGIGLIVLGVVVFLTALGLRYLFPKEQVVPFWGVRIGGTLALAGTVWFTFGQCLMWLHDPDKLPEVERRTLAAERTMSLADFNHLQETRLRQKYQEFGAAIRAVPSGTTPGTQPVPLVVDWWLMPTTFINGGCVHLKVTPGDHATLVITEDTKPGDVLGIRASGGVLPFKIRVFPIRVHPDEQRLE